ncbi:MAG: DNA-3-methyladenine glycosylase [Dethiobacter sp.]|jgi:DNA-3-methyladenine glycosylase|nr:DNA-3-methyladenine glycosylase [Dethiobacter sp.]
MRRLTTDFYLPSTTHVAKELLGKILVHATEDGTCSGRVVEVEAYLSRDDPACHAARGRTARNAAMFGPPGTAYVYLIYGIYHCFNVVTHSEGVGEAVLVRALEPLAGLELMCRRRDTDNIKMLTSGPGMLCRAMSIGSAQNGADLTTGSLYLADDYFCAGDIAVTTRIGITTAADLPLRFYLKGNPFVSRK